MLNATGYIVQSINYIKNLHQNMNERFLILFWFISSFQAKMVFFILTSKAPSQSVEWRNSGGLSLILTKVCWISVMVGASLIIKWWSPSISIEFRFLAIHEHIDWSVRYAQPQPWNETNVLNGLNLNRKCENQIAFTHHITVIVTTIMKIQKIPFGIVGFTVFCWFRYIRCNNLK